MKHLQNCQNFVWMNLKTSFFPKLFLSFLTATIIMKENENVMIWRRWNKNLCIFTSRELEIVVKLAVRVRYFCDILNISESLCTVLMSLKLFAKFLCRIYKLSVELQTDLDFPDNRMFKFNLGSIVSLIKGFIVI